MKKILALVLALIMILAFVACDNSKKQETSEGTSSAQTEQKTESPTESAPETEGSSETDSATGEGEGTEGNTEPDSESDTEKDTESETQKDTEKDTETNTDKNTESDTEKDTETEFNGDVEADTEIGADIDYYFAVVQKELERTLYFSGEIDGYYAMSTSDRSKAVTVRLESTNGGFFMYFIDGGVKYYVNLGMQGKLARVNAESEAKTVFVYDAALATLKTNLDGKDYFLGMYDTYSYFTASEVGYASESFVAILAKTECAHLYVADSDGHSALACARCNLPAGEKLPHSASVVTREPGQKTTCCADCGYTVSVAYCDESHWVATAEGHYIGACDICGTAASSQVKPHSESLSEFVTDTEYKMGCSVCAYAFYTKNLENIPYIVTAQMWGVRATTYYQIYESRSYGWFYYEDGDIPYGRVTGDGKNAVQVLYNRSRNDSSAGSDAQQYKMDVGNARFLAIKIRTNENTQHMNLYLSTTVKNGGKSYTFPLSMIDNNEWGVMIIDLAATFGDAYGVDAQTGTYLIDSFYFTMNNMAKTTDIDIAYMIFFEGSSITDMRSFIDEENAILISGSATSKISLIPGACTGEHSYIVEAVDGTCKYKCMICGATGGLAEHSYSIQPVNGVCSEKCIRCGTIGATDVHVYTTQIVDGYYVGRCADCGSQKSYGVKADDVKHFFSPDAIKVGSSAQGTYDMTLKSENGVEFVRVDNFVPAGTSDKWGGFTLSNPSGAETGKYMVMKIRVGNNGLNQSHLAMFIRSTGSGLVSGMGVSVKVSEDNEWHVIVIDLSTRVQDAATYFGTDADGLYRARYIQIRPFSNNQVGAQADDYMDIAYIAFCDELDDICTIVGERSYEWSVDRSTSELRKTADHGCAAHSPSAVTTQAVEGGTMYVATCTVCSKKCYEKFVPDSVSKFYTAKDFATSAPMYFNAGKDSVLYDDESGVVFGRDTSNLQIIWHRSQGDLKYSTRSSQTTTLDVGNARFFVIKVRTSDAARTLKLNYSTTAKNSTTAIATEEIANGYTIGGVKGIKVGDTYCTDQGFTTVTLPMASVTEGEWTTFVIDLEAVMGEFHGKVDGADSIVVDTFYFDLGSQAGNIDVELMAFVEGDWSDVAELCGEDTVWNITNKSGGFEERKLGN